MKNFIVITYQQRHFRPPFAVQYNDLVIVSRIPERHKQVLSLTNNSRIKR